MGIGLHRPQPHQADQGSHHLTYGGLCTISAVPAPAASASKCGYPDALLAEGRTTFVIAHRLATIRGADRILVVTGEGIAEQGTHAELLAGRGAYRSLHEAQFGPERLAST